MPSPFSMETNLPSSLRRRLSSPNQSEKVLDKATEQSSKARELLSRQIEVNKKSKDIDQIFFDPVQSDREGLS